jgi:hypothetical protein
MGIDFNDAEDIDPALLEQAKKGEAAMKNTVSTDNASLKISGGGDLSFDEVLQKSQNDLTKVKQIISQGGFTGPEKDKHNMSLHHAEWTHSRNLYMKCDSDVKEKSVRYVTLDKGKAQNHEIMKAHKEWADTREICKKSSSDLLEKANKYVETDRRVRANKKAEGEIYPSLSQNVEGFIGSESIKEGFDFYNGSDYKGGNRVITAGTTSGATITPAVMRFNTRLPLYTDTQRTTTTTTDNSNTILPWGEYYTDCNGAPDNKKLCENANIQKNNYIVTINQLFDRSDRLLNTYYKMSSLTGTQNNEKINEILLNDSNIKSIMENQKKNIALHKQNALYDYDEYNSLSFYEDLVGFLYYAVFVIFAALSLRDFFASASGAYDKRNIIILILLGIYPKYILPVVLWILNGLTNITEMLGVKNVHFWGA